MNQDTMLDEDAFLHSREAGKYVVKKPLTGYKRIRCKCLLSNGSEYLDKNAELEIPTYLDKIAELEIPTDATIIRPVDMTLSMTFSDIIPSSRLRTNRAILKSIDFKNDNNMNYCVCYSLYDEKYKYKVGQEHEPENPLDDDIYKECTSGIHFFLEKEKAKNY